jgi:glucan phosphoethanolaminetransferase (alkaline phosphatase superfamily)
MNHKIEKSYYHRDHVREQRVVVRKAISLPLSLLTAILITFFLFIPDIVLKLLQPYSHKSVSFTFFSLTFIFSFFLGMIGSRSFQFFLLTILCSLQLIGSLYIGYFGAEIMPEIIHKFFENPLEDAWEVLIVFFSSFSALHVLLIGVSLSYALIILVLYKTEKFLFKMPGAAVITTILLLSLPLRAGLHTSVYLFYPDALKPSLYNTINSISVYVRQTFTTSHNATQQFLNYNITQSSPKARNIIIIMGESTRSDYMSLFGYLAPTTPLLDQKQKDLNFIYRTAFSGATSTIAALQTFFNLMLEPGNFNAIVSKNTNLFRLAKMQGYKTILISAQSCTLFYGIGTEYIDHFITKESINSEQFYNRRDLVLLDILQSIALSSDKNFIVLHIRSPHAPYEDNYSQIILC